MQRFARLQNVTIKGNRVKSAGEMVNPDDIRINDKPIQFPSKYALLWIVWSIRSGSHFFVPLSISIMLHKPRGYVTSRKREIESKIIYDLLPVRTCLTWLRGL